MFRYLNPHKPPCPARPRRGGRATPRRGWVHSFFQMPTNKQIKGGGGTLSKPREGVPHPPLQNPRGGPPPPSRTKDRVPPPSGCTHPATVSDGVTTEVTVPHIKYKGGTPPLKSTRGGYLPPCPKYEWGYTHPLSKKRGGVTSLAYPHSETREGVPLPPCHTKDPPFLSHEPERWFAWSHDREGIARPGIREGGIPPLIARTGYHPLPPSKIQGGYPTHPTPPPGSDRGVPHSGMGEGSSSQ
jgi:hypothetical protein